MLMTLPPPRKIWRSRLFKALAPHRGALLALALFLIVGLAVLDDYGVTLDEPTQRQTVQASLGYVAGGDLAVFLSSLIHSREDRFYGMAFEAAIILVERALGLEEVRGAWALRHLLIHLFFLTGGLFAYFLARRLSGNSLVGLFGMAIFLLHPRLYAHSFFNSKDIAFLAMFAVALYLAHRAFRRNTVAAFVLLGVGVGILLNLRIMGVVPLAAIPTLRALDFTFAQGWAERKRVLLTTGAFALASLLTAYALLPYLWADPLARAAEGWTTFSDYHYKPHELFRGLLGRSADFPEYIPVWFSITTPPFTLLLGLIGGAAILLRAAKSPREASRNTRLRFGLLLVGCAAAPVAAVVLLSANVYQDWRHLYFLWAPFALLAVVGLAALPRALGRPRLRATVYGAAGAGLAATLASMALIHPNQQVYFSFAVDRAAPDHLRAQYMMDYSGHPGLQALEWLLDNIDSFPDETSGIPAHRDVWHVSRDNIRFLPDAAFARIKKIKKTAHVRIQWWGWARSARSLHRAQVYGNTIFTIERTDDLQAVYEATREREPDVVGAYDVYELDDVVALVMEPCAPSFIENVGATLRVTPVDPADLPPWRDGKRVETSGFGFSYYGAFFDGKCAASLPLPDYPIADIEFIWEPELLSSEAARATMRRAKEEGRLLARSAYDVYLADGQLVYVQEPCDPLDTEPPFRVSVFPQRAGDLPEQWRERGHERFGFNFHQRGALLEEGACVALFPLPDYPVAAVRTGQRAEGEGDLWSAAFPTNPEPYRTAYRAVDGSEPLARGAFDLYLLDGDLVYAKEPCDQADTDARFFLHVTPERVGDLPEERRELGFDNLDFRFFLNGAWFDGKCAARVALPDYPIASVRTGQFVSGEGEIWSAEFAAAR